MSYRREQFSRIKPGNRARVEAAIEEGGLEVHWSTEVDRIERLGVVEPGRAFTGRVAWNKFLVVVTLEEEDDPEAATWSGPIVLRGMSRSGMMHTMAGHGPFQQENCAAYGYD